MYRLYIPAPFAHIAAESAIAEKHFQDARPADAAEYLIFRKNPNQIVTVTDAAQKVLAYADMFVLQPQRYHDLIADLITEDVLQPECFLPWPDAAKAEHIYCAGIAVGDLDHPDRSLIANTLLFGCMRLLEKFYLTPDKTLDCSMIAYSNSGERIAKRLDFVAQGPHAYGVLYRRPIDFAALQNLYALLPPLEAMVTIIE